LRELFWRQRDFLNFIGYNQLNKNIDENIGWFSQCVKQYGLHPDDNIVVELRDFSAAERVVEVPIHYRKPSFASTKSR